MSVNPKEYEPKYVSTEHIPIEIEEHYDLEEKREALFQAETRLEIDRNGGVELPEDELTPTHYAAVQNLATYHLTRSATSNDDVTLGDLDDGGEQTERHAQQYKDTYFELIEQLAESGPDGQSGTYFGVSGKDGETLAVNSGESARRHQLDEYGYSDPVHPDYTSDNE